jgi:uncharacterized protein YggT (Ycf19 family)
VNVGSAFLRTLFMVFDLVLGFIYWLVLIWVILSWVMLFASQSSFRWRYRGVYNALAIINEFFTRATYPLLRPFRRLLPPHRTAGIDWSPLLLLVAIWAIRIFFGMLFAPTVF